MIPDLVTINRTEKELYEDLSSRWNILNNMGIEIINKDLEGYRDAALGTIVFNKTTVPKTSCEEFRLVDKINDGSLYRTKLGKFYIYQYTRDGESVAITLNQNTSSCGRRLYHTGIPNIQVLLLEDKEECLNKEN